MRYPKNTTIGDDYTMEEHALKAEKNRTRFASMLGGISKKAPANCGSLRLCELKNQAACFAPSFSRIFCGEEMP